uniref:Uncharacterized protein n=1 Tax=Anguilla anguilla TaxID=7936 RepID=A0A0E9TW90_ANGAN
MTSMGHSSHPILFFCLLTRVFNTLSLEHPKGICLSTWPDKRFYTLFYTALC